MLNINNVNNLKTPKMETSGPGEFSMENITKNLKKH